MSAYARPDDFTLVTTPTTTSSSLPIPADARSMVAGASEYAPSTATEKQQILKSLASKILESVSTPEAQKLAMSIFAYINSDNGLNLSKEQQNLTELAKKLSKPESTPEQLKIATHVFNYLAGGEDIGGVFAACNKYFRTHEMSGWFSRNEVGKIIKQIYELSKEKYKKELQSASSKLVGDSGIFSFGDDEDFASLSPSPSIPQKIIDFFNKPGENHYLFVRTFAFGSEEYEMQQLSAPVEDGSVYWRSFTAIKSGVPIILHPYPYAIGFLFSNNIDILKTVEGKEAWGKGDLRSNERYRSKGLLNSPVSRLPLPDERLCRIPIGEKLEEIKLRRSGMIPDMTNKERNGTRKKSEKLPSRYKGKKDFSWNEALGHATNAHLLGLIIHKYLFHGDLESFSKFGLPIFEYDYKLGKLSLLNPSVSYY